MTEINSELSAEVKIRNHWWVRAMRSKIAPIKKMTTTLRNKRELLLNWFRANGQFSSGAVFA